MKRYYVVTNSDHSKFCRDVTDLLNEGWECVGGVSASQKKSSGSLTIYTMFHQAMVMEK